jgi:hypothetical protein
MLFLDDSLKDKNSVPLGVQPHGFLEHGAVTQIDVAVEQFAKHDFEPGLVEQR